MYFTYGAEQLDYGDMNSKDMGDYETLKPFDGDEDLMQDEKREERLKTVRNEREGQEVLDEVRTKLALQTCEM